MMEIVLHPGLPVSLSATFDCGQAFRWRKMDCGAFLGLVQGRVATARELEDGAISLHVKGSGLLGKEAERLFWEDYFALDVDYAALHLAYARDGVLKRAMAFSPGIRVLRQDFFEALITFIISQNNNIPRIRSIVEKMCMLFGEEIGTDGCGNPLFSFPTPKRLASLETGDLAPLRAGYRDRAILEAARSVESGEISSGLLKSQGIDGARKELLKLRGVGPKVAECVLLFGLGYFGAFPLDTWMKKVMASFYPGGLPAFVMPTAGIAQQYLFHYGRNSHI